MRAQLTPRALKRGDMLSDTAVHVRVSGVGLHHLGQQLVV